MSNAGPSEPHIPPPPVTTATNGEALNNYVKQYREIEEIKNETMRTFFEKTVTVTALPLLSTLVGYLIGRRSAQADRH